MMDTPQPPTDSKALLDQGEELLDSSRRLLANIDDALRRDGSTLTVEAPAESD